MQLAFFAKAQKRRRGKDKSIRKPNHNKPGKGTSADHMVSHQPGLIPQVTGKLTHDRYSGSTTFVDHASNYCYLHMMRSISNKETVQGKDAYKRIMRSYGIEVESYHGDNSRFDS